MDKYYVYRFLNSESEVVYVGKTKQPLEKRILIHFGNSGHLRKDQISMVTRIEFLELGSRIEMDIVELYYINKWKPAFNTQSKYDDDDYFMENRDKDCWEVFNFEVGKEETELPSKLRVEVVLTEADTDIIEYLETNDMPRATQIKMSIRSQIQRKQDEQIDDRIKRLLYDAIADVSRDTPSDYKQAWLNEKAEKERLALELEQLKESLRQLMP